MGTPKLPYLYRVLSLQTFELDDIGAEIVLKEQEKQIAFERACKVQGRLVKVRNEMEMGNTPNTVQSLQDLEKDVLKICEVTRRERDGNTSGTVEDYVRAKSFWYFIQTGNLMPHSSVSHYATDEEYLAGACMGMCQDLARYGMMVAINRDLKSIRLARDLCNDLIEHLIDYDFTNSYLKRRFDDTENAFKTLETIMYEVSMTAQQTETEVFWPVKKRAKIDSTIDTETEEGDGPSPRNLAHLVEVRNRMAKRDELRAALTKYCSVVKRAAKKTIFYLHHGKGGKAYQQITKCETTIRDKLQPIILEEPPLRAGTYNMTMESYSEAKLFYAWMFGKERTPDDTESALLKPTDFPVDIGNPENYLVGLISMTSEISRFSMQARTERDFEKVKHCLATCAAIGKGVLSIERPPLKLEKKVATLKRSVGRLERALYEMSLQTASGGQKFISETSVIGSSSLMPMIPKLAGTAGANPSAAGAAMNNAVPDGMGMSNFPALSNPFPKHGGPAVAKYGSGGPSGGTSDERSASSEDTGDSDPNSSTSSDNSHKKKHAHFKKTGPSDGDTPRTSSSKAGRGRWDVSEAVKDALTGSSIPMTLEVKNQSGEGTTDVAMTLSVSGKGSKRSLTLQQNDDQPEKPPPSGA